MRLYIELINQRYDDQGVALGAFPAAEWKLLLERLKEARANCGTETEASGSSFDPGVGVGVRRGREGFKLPSSVVLLLNADGAQCGASLFAPLLKLRDEVEGKGGVLRVLKVEEIGHHVEAVANTLSGDHGFERRGVHFRCVAGDECGLKVYQGDPGYAELEQADAEARKGATKG